MEVVAQRKHLELESSYIEDYRTEIRKKTVPWGAFARTDLITTQQAKQLTELEEVTVTKRVEKILSEEHVDNYVATLFDLLAKDMPQERINIKQYVLVVLSDLLNEDVFTKKVLSKDPTKVLATVVKYLDAADEVTRLLALYVTVYFLIQPQFANADSSVVAKVFNLLHSLIESTNFDLKFLALELVTELLAVKSFRPVFWQSHSEYIPTLFQNLNSHISHNSTESIQFQYKVLLALWLLTFDNKALREFSMLYLPETLSLLQLARNSIKEKIVRLVISIFINLTSIPANESLNVHNLKYLILIGDILPTVNNLKERKWSDEELIEDLGVLSNSIQEVYAELTSFDEYLQELDSKKFKNSPVHSNDEFFLDNLTKFQDGKYKVFKQLLNLLDEHMEPASSVLLLSDIGKILKLDSRAIDVLNRENKKATIMGFLAHGNSEVRYEALKATQFIVSQTFK